MTDFVSLHIFGICNLVMCVLLQQAKEEVHTYVVNFLVRHDNIKDSDA